MDVRLTGLSLIVWMQLTSALALAVSLLSLSDAPPVINNKKPPPIDVILESRGKLWLRNTTIITKAGLVTPCKKHRECPRKYVCDKHYGTCITKRSEGEECRGNKQCKKSLHCVFGYCTAKPHRGREGSQCKKKSDCDPGLCCANKQGYKLCQKLLTENERCYIPDGGLEYALNEMCPCQEGLLCKFYTDKHLAEWIEEFGDSQLPYNPSHYMKCSRL